MDYSTIYLDTVHDVEDDIDISLVLPGLTSTSFPGYLLFPFLGTPRKGRSETLGAWLV